VTATHEGTMRSSVGDTGTEKRGMNLTLRVWRQQGPTVKGKMVTYKVTDISPDMSFLEMLDVLNEQLILQGDDPVAFDIEPWRATAFPVIKDLAVDRRAFDRIIQAGGYISVPTGTAPEAHATPVPKKDADNAFDAATCIGCGACVAACPNASSMLFTAAKVTHLGLLPQGQPERNDRVVNMVAQQDREGFGGCTNIGECSAACPKGISMETISRLNHDLLGALRAGVRPKS
jgi:succinate dehydrogenase / fumarate reductase iron-sulfur subunit